MALAGAILFLLALSVARFDGIASRQLVGGLRVSDGDSLVIDGERVRLRGIDAPEYAQECTLGGKSFACGREARNRLQRLIAGRSVTCRGWERDRYERLLAHCEAGGLDLGEQMVGAGWAVSYGDYRSAEAQARSARKGLWAGSFEEPSAWRARQDGMEERPHDWFGLVLNLLRHLLRSGA